MIFLLMRLYGSDSEFYLFFTFQEAAFRKVVQATMVRDRQHGPVVELNRIQVTHGGVLSLCGGVFLGSEGVLRPRAERKSSS